MHFLISSANKGLQYIYLLGAYSETEVTGDLMKAILNCSGEEDLAWCQTFKRALVNGEVYHSKSYGRVLVVMKTGIAEHFSTTSEIGFKSNNKIPSYATNYKKEYLYIRGLNNDIKYFENRIENLNNGLFITKNVDRIKSLIKSFLRYQEKGKLKDISKMIINEDEITNIIKTRKHFDLWYLRWLVFIEDGEDVYPGFKNIYDVFTIFFNKLNIKYEDSDSDSDSEIVYANGISESDSDSDSDDF